MIYIRWTGAAISVSVAYRQRPCVLCSNRIKALAACISLTAARAQYVILTNGLSLIIHQTNVLCKETYLAPIAAPLSKLLSYVPFLTALKHLFSSSVLKSPKSDICRSQQ
nr:MAG TPA: hypothetical protein [Caudoviricetes sp.]